MKPHPPRNPDQTELFRNRLDNQLNMNHELVRLSALIYWSIFHDRFGTLYPADKQRFSLWDYFHGLKCLDFTLTSITR